MLFDRYRKGLWATASFNPGENHSIGLIIPPVPPEWFLGPLQDFSWLGLLIQIPTNMGSSVRLSSFIVLNGTERRKPDVFSIALCSPAFSGLMEHSFVGKKFQSEHPSKTPVCFPYFFVGGGRLVGSGGGGGPIPDSQEGTPASATPRQALPGPRALQGTALGLVSRRFSVTPNSGGLAVARGNRILGPTSREVRIRGPFFSVPGVSMTLKKWGHYPKLKGHGPIC